MEPIGVLFLVFYEGFKGGIIYQCNTVGRFVKENGVSGMLWLFTLVDRWF